MLLGSALAYNGIEEYLGDNYKMKIPEAEYFIYAIPAVLCFIIGLNINSQNNTGERININAIKQFVRLNPRLPLILIIIGFVSGFIESYFPSELAFVFYLLSGFKFIGLFLMILGETKLRVSLLIVVYGSIFLSSLQGGLFHDLLTWLIFLGAVFSIKYKPNISLKLAGISVFIILSIIIQITKGTYREETWEAGKEAGVGTFTESTAISTSASGGFFRKETIAPHVVRINQGFIISNILSYVPANEPFSNGESMVRIIKSAVLPRILAPDKLNAGDREIFMQYSGLVIDAGTSMGLSSVGDAYVNFGIIGGCIFMFFYGLLFNWSLKRLDKSSVNYPAILLFAPLIYVYPIRPDCELQTILGHLVKSIFLVFVIFRVFSSTFKLKGKAILNYEEGR